MKCPVSGKRYGEQERVNLCKCADELLDGVRSEHWAREFEDALAQHVGLNRSVALCNSGSSANLLAISALGLKPGDEVITTAVCFPTTVNPIVQCGAIPVFVDVTLPALNADMGQVEAAVTDRTRAIVLAHTLGNPFDLNALMPIVHKYGLTLISDCCDALGSLYANRPVESYGHYSTMSFYPAHHISTEEGGAVVTESEHPLNGQSVRSFRDWGRDCYCKPGHDDTCGKRFADGCDHKYEYSHLGYHLAMTNMQAALGVAQMGKLKSFGETRRRNHARLSLGLDDLRWAFMLPEATDHSDPSWFGFALGVREDAPFSRLDAELWLEANGIATRPLFAGDIRRHEAFDGVSYRTVRDDAPECEWRLPNTRFVDERVFWIGCYPGLTDAHIDYMVDKIHDLCREKA